MSDQTSVMTLELYVQTVYPLPTGVSVPEATSQCVTVAYEIFKSPVKVYFLFILWFYSIHTM